MMDSQSTVSQSDLHSTLLNTGQLALSPIRRLKPIHKAPVGAGEKRGAKPLQNLHQEKAVGFVVYPEKRLWKQTGSCFDRTGNVPVACARPGKHVTDPELGFRQTQGHAFIWNSATGDQLSATFGTTPKAASTGTLPPSFAAAKAVSRGGTSTWRLGRQLLTLKPKLNALRASTGSLAATTGAGAFGASTTARPDTAKGRPGSARPRPTSAFRSSAFSLRSNAPNTRLRLFYDQSHCPFQLKHGCVKNELSWKVPVCEVNYHRFLPVFVDGMRELEEPYAFAAVQACLDLCKSDTHKKLTQVVPFVVEPIKACLETRDPVVILRVLRFVQVRQKERGEER
jgi:hypothetical protein